MNILKVLTKRRRTGNLGEDAAVKMLRKKHYKILKRNYVAEGREIDIIARVDGHLVFIEVKTRTYESQSLYEARPCVSVDKDKMRGIISASRVFRSAYEGDERMRYDVIEVYLDKSGRVIGCEHLEAAFTKDRL